MLLSSRDARDQHGSQGANLEEIAPGWLTLPAGLIIEISGRPDVGRNASAKLDEAGRSADDHATCIRLPEGMGGGGTACRWRVLVACDGSDLVSAVEARADPRREVRKRGARPEQVKGARIAFAPGQPTPYHLHPIPVVGVVTRGAFIFQIEGQPARTIKAGEPFFEPADTRIARFDNASADEPAEIVAFYLVDRPDRELIRIIGGN
jgi:quercetin dioxygenase-like cupin family protein